jgi:hypothetical protein
MQFVNLDFLIILCVDIMPLKVSTIEQKTQAAF